MTQEISKRASVSSDTATGDVDAVTWLRGREMVDAARTASVDPTIECSREREGVRP